MKFLLNPSRFSLILLGLCYQVQFSGFSQSKDEQVTDYIHTLNSIWSDFNTITFDKYIIDSSLVLNEDVFKIDENSSRNNVLAMQLKINQLQQTINKKDVGLNAILNYQENLRSPLVDPEEIVVFKRRAIIGLDWNLLNNGLYENVLKNKILKYNYNILKQQQVRNQTNSFLDLQYAQIISYFNSKKITILNSRKSLNSRQLSVIEKLWAIKYITKDNYLKAIQNTTDIDAQFNLYQNYNDITLKNKKPLEFELPILDINIEKLFQQLNQSFSFDSTLLADEQIVKYQSSYLKDVSLKAFTRYNYYDVYNANLPNRSYVSIGMNLSMPITFNQKDKRDLYLTQNLLNKSKESIDTSNFQAVILNKYYEYQYKLKQFKNLYHKRLVFEELLRTENAKSKLGDLEFNPNTALFILDDYWSNAIELIDLKQGLYKLLLDIKALAPTINIIEYTTQLNLSNLQIANSNPSFKAVYIWSDVFKNYSSTLINEYCKINDFNPLLISFNTSTKGYINKMSEFIKDNQSSQIHLLIGSNKLLQGGIINYLDTLKLKINLNLVKGLHLDVEPHVAPDFKSNKDLYFKKYIDLIKEVKLFVASNHLELSVSIPLNYPENVLTELNSLCNHVYLMAYENVDVDFIERKASEEKQILNDKCVLALRTKDFGNRTEMEAAFKKIGFKNIAYHDLDDLMHFDNESINSQEEPKKK
jgi:hypothetical protein